MVRTAVSAGSFVASLVSSLAWPAVVVTILVIFHKQFGTMLERLARVRIGAGGVEADVDWDQTEAVVRQSLVAARRQVGEPITAGSPASPAGGLPRPGAPRPSAQLRPGAGPAGRDVERPPQALVEDRWQSLSDELRGVIRPGGSLGEGQLAAADFDQLMDAALRAGLLDAVTVRSLDGLRHLRNLARANPGLTQRQAQEFAVLADAVSYSMRRDSGSVWPAA
jgi:hypothetical protein